MEFFLNRAQKALTEKTVKNNYIKTTLHQKITL